MYFHGYRTHAQCPHVRMTENVMQIHMAMAASIVNARRVGLEPSVNSQVKTVGSSQQTICEQSHKDGWPSVNSQERMASHR